MMNKFSDPNDKNYQLLAGRIAELVKGSHATLRTRQQRKYFQEILPPAVYDMGFGIADLLLIFEQGF
jgi:hypothetical protein